MAAEADVPELEEKLLNGEVALVVAALERKIRKKQLLIAHRNKSGSRA